MILIVGNNHDDILYFETRMTNVREDIIFKKYTVVVGDISNQTVVLLKNIYTNIVSSTVVNYIIDKYFILFVIKIGKCLTASTKFKNGDVVIGKTIFTPDIDVSDIQGTKLGQIPGYEYSFETNHDLQNMVINSFGKYSFEDIRLATVFSSNIHYKSLDQIKELIHNNQLFDQKIDEIVFDSEAYGIGVACALQDIPFITVNVILNKIGDKFTTTNYIKVLKKYSIVGKAISNVVSELGNKEVLRK